MIDYFIFIENESSVWHLSVDYKAVLSRGAVLQAVPSAIGKAPKSKVSQKGKFTFQPFFFIESILLTFFF